MLVAGRPVSDRLDVVCQSIITVLGMEPGHGPQVVREVLRQTAWAKLALFPLLQWLVDVPDGSPEGLGILRRHLGHIL